MRKLLSILVLLGLLIIPNTVTAEANGNLNLDLKSAFYAMESNQTIENLPINLDVKIVKIEDRQEETYHELSITKLEDKSLSVAPGVYKIYVQIDPHTVLEFNNDSIGYEITPESTVSIQIYNTLGSDVTADAPWRIEPGEDIPITYIVKDTLPYILYIRKIEVYHDGAPTGSESGDTLVHTKTLERNFAQNLWYGIDYLSPSRFNDADNDIEIHVKFDIRMEVDVHKYFTVHDSPSGLPSLPRWYYGDTHYHSIYSDNACEFGAPVEATAETGRAMGLDYVTITDHSFDLDSSKWSSLQTDSSTYSSIEFKVLPAEEVSTRLLGTDIDIPGQFQYNHYLVYDIGNYIPGGEWEDGTPWPLYTSYTPSELISLVNNNGGFGYVAHPFADDQFREPWQDYSLNFTGLQVWNGILATTNEVNTLQQGIDKWNELLRDGRHVFISGGTDAHGDFSHVDSEFFSCKILEKYYGGSNNAYGKVRTAVYTTDFSHQGILSALENGHSIITDGPFVVFDIDGTIIGNSKSISQGQSINLNIAWKSTSEFGQLSKIKLIKGDLTAKTESATEYTINSYSGTKSISLTPSNNVYYRLEATTDKGYLAYTNPIWVDVQAPPDISAPTIYNTYTSPSVPSSSDSVDVYSTITDPAGVSYATTWYTIDGVNWYWMPMLKGFLTDVWGTLFSIPPLPDGASLQFTVCAEDSGGNFGCEFGAYCSVSQALAQETAKVKAEALAMLESNATAGTDMVALDFNSFDAVKAQEGCDAAVHEVVIGCVDNDAPGTPTLYSLASPDTDGEYTVDWSDVSDVGCSGLKEYELQETVSGVTATYHGTASNYYVAGKSDGTYYYKVRAVDNAGNPSGWSVTRAFDLNIIKI